MYLYIYYYIFILYITIHTHTHTHTHTQARTQNGQEMGGATADAPWRLNVEKQEEQMNRDWNKMHGGGGRPPQVLNIKGSNKALIRL